MRSKPLLVIFVALSLVTAGAGETCAQAQAFFGVTRNLGINASSFNSDSFVLTNESSAGIEITGLRVDFSTGFLPDMVFDPDGIAGDTASKCFEANSGTAATGLVDPGDECSDPFASPHSGGYDVIELEFTDFDPGETFGFATDADPTSIRGTSGQGGNSAGSVSGLELVGATIQVTFSNGTTRTGELFRQPGSSGGAEVRLGASPPATPGLTAVGLTSPATVSSASQTLRVTGAEGADVRLLQVEAAMDLNGGNGFDIDPFEGNRAIVVSEDTGTIGANGRADFNVTLTRSSSAPGFNYFVAVIVGGAGRTGLTSPVVILSLDDAEECDSNGDCSDGNPCTNDVCDDGTCTNPNNSASCDDGIFCNGDDTCSGGSCSTHDGDPCSGGGQCADQCNEAAESCNAQAGTPCDDGLFCNGADACLGGTCSTHVGDPCADGDECDDECDEATNSCEDPAGAECTDDGNACTDDECDGNGDCVHPANTAACDDDDACTTDDVCSDGACVGATPVECSDGAACNGTETCDSESGCRPGTPVDCSSLDGDCSIGSCVESGTECTATPINDGEPCDDLASDGCWSNLRCESGTCVGDSACDALCEACGTEGACLPLCGHPVSTAEGDVLASDALYTLQSAVRILECALCVCDVNDDGLIAATDALTVLTRSVAPETPLACPSVEPALGATTTTSTLP
jgi:hypothetical protein